MVSSALQQGTLRIPRVASLSPTPDRDVPRKEAYGSVGLSERMHGIAHLQDRRRDWTWSLLPEVRQAIRGISRIPDFASIGISRRGIPFSSKAISIEV